MLTRMVPVLKVLVIVLAVGLVVVAVLYGQYILFGSEIDTPRTELERAVVAAEQAVRANPEDASARVKLAAAYLEEGSPSLAIEQAEIAIQLAPDDPSGHYVLGLAHRDDGDGDAAVASLTTAAGMEGQVAQFYQDTYVAIARVQKDDGDFEAAIVAMDSAIDHGPENALLLYERGSMYEEEGNLEFALIDYTWALSYVPNYEPAREAYDRIAVENPELLEQVIQLLEEEDRLFEEDTNGEDSE